MTSPTTLDLANKLIASSSTFPTLPSSNALSDVVTAKLRETEKNACELANLLRVKDPKDDVQTSLGKTQLPNALTTVIKASLDSSRTPHPGYLPAVYEVLRVAANFCMEHDGNRQTLIDADFTHTLVSMLEGYAQRIPSTPAYKPLRVSIPDLKAIKTAIGVLLNATVNYQPAKASLADAAFVILRLSCAIYPPGAWYGPSAREVLPEGSHEPSDELVQESWTLRSGLSSWAWRALEELKEDGQPLFEPNALSELVRPLRAYVPPLPSEAPAYIPPSLARTLVTTDFDALEESCSTMEGLIMDDEDARLSLARGLTFPEEHGGVCCLSEILTFVDKGDYHPLWALDTPVECSRREKAFNLCKAALIKVVVEVAGEDKNTDVLWDDSESTPGGIFVAQMVEWVKAHRNLHESTREDLVICATLSLGNLVRHEAHSIAIINPPIALGTHLSAILEPDVDAKVKHGVIALLRHLAYTPATRVPLSEAGIVERLVACDIFKDKSDVVELVQVNAIGVAKNMCNGNAENCFAFVLDSKGKDSESTGLRQLLALIKRSDKIVVKSEGTRVLVNIIRTLWSASTPESDKRRAAMEAIACAPVAIALAQLIGRSKKYPVLINEAIVALTLLSLSAEGAKHVLDAIVTPLPTEAPPAQNALSGIDAAEPSPSIMSPVAAPGRALDMLEYVLRTKNARFPEEISVNVCLLLGHVARKENGVGQDREVELAQFTKEVRPLLQREAGAASESKLKVAASKALATMA